MKQRFNLGRNCALLRFNCSITFNCSMSTIVTLEKGVKYAQS